MIPVEWKNVMSFGACGDGAHDDTRAIRRAAQAARGEGGGVVYFPAGCYLVSRSGQTSAFDLHGMRHLIFAGAGRELSQLQVASGLDLQNGKFNLFCLDETTQYIAFRDLMLDGNRGAVMNPHEQTHGIRIRGCHEIHMERVVLRRHDGDGVCLTGDVARGAGNITASGCEFRDNGRMGLNCQGSFQNVHVLDNHFAGNGQQSMVFASIGEVGLDDNAIMGNTFLHDREGEAVTLGSDLVGEDSRRGGIIFSRNQIVDGELVGCHLGRLIFFRQHHYRSEQGGGGESNQCG